MIKSITTEAGKMKSLLCYLATLSTSRVFGIGRSLIGLGLLITLLVDGTDVLFAPDINRFPLGRCDAGTILDKSFFCVFGFETGRWLGIALALLVVIGLTPALTALPFAYLAWSVQATIAIPEGGDQLASNIAILMVPLSLLDWRLHQWQPGERLRNFAIQSGLFATSVRITCLLLIWLQMSIVYFFAAVEKFPVEEWKEGTAMYYWATDPNFGATGLRLSLLEMLTTNPVFVVMLTWGTLLLELLLAAAWMSNRSLKSVLYLGGIIFHGGIAVFMGLISFSLIMIGGLTIYLGTTIFHPAPQSPDSSRRPETGGDESDTNYEPENPEKVKDGTLVPNQA